MRRIHLLAALLIATAPVLADDGSHANHRLPAATYCVYDVGRLPALPPGEISLILEGINERDQIVGWTGESGRALFHAFIWDRKRGMRDLGTVPGHESMTATAINDAGKVVGAATDTETDEVLAYVWTRGRGARTFDSSLGGVNSFATDINRSGQIVGASETETGALHAFLRDANGEILDLGAFPDGSGSSRAIAMNDRGQVVGFRFGDVNDAFLWDERRGMRPLIDPTPGDALFPLDINNRAVVVGTTFGTETQRAFRWTRSQGAEFLGNLSGDDAHLAIARSINLWGLIVGGSQTASGFMHGFIWSRRTGMLDLNELIDPSTVLPFQPGLGLAVAINDGGSIAVNGFAPGDPSPHGFLMVPKRHARKACPQP